MGCQLNQVHLCLQGLLWRLRGNFLRMSTSDHELLLLDMRAIGMAPSFSFLFGTGFCLIPQTGDSLLTWLLSGLLGWIMFQFSKRVYLLERAFSLISWLRVFRFCPVNHVAGVKLCQPLFLWGCMAFKGFDFHSDWSLNLFSSSLMLIDQSV